MKWLNYQHLYYLWNIVHNGSITKASEKLRLSQPTLSAQIKSLEQALGERLFERKGRELKLTEIGIVVYDYAEKIFSLGNELLEVLDGNKQQTQREFKIGISDVIPKTLVFKIIKPVFVKFNNIKVVCLEDKTEKLFASLAIGDIDLVISDRPIPAYVKVKGYSHFFGSSDISFIGCTDFKKLYKKNFPKSLAGAPLLIPTEESILYKEIIEWFESQGIKPKICATFQDTALMKIAAKEKIGIIPIPKVIAAEICRSYGLELIGSSSEIKEKLYVISLERKLKNPVIIEICDLSSRLFK